MYKQGKGSSHASQFHPFQYLTIRLCWIFSLSPNRAYFYVFRFIFFYFIVWDENFWFFGFFNGSRVFFWLTCVCVNPKLAANSARSGRAKYCVRWNRRLSCCSWSELYIVLGFLIFLPLPFTRRPVSSILSVNVTTTRIMRRKGK